MTGQSVVLEVGGLHWATSEDVVERALGAGPGCRRWRRTPSPRPPWSPTTPPSRR